MAGESTTAAVQRYLDAFAGEAPPEPIVRELLDRAVHRLLLLSGALLHRSYPRLTQPPLNLATEELLGGVVAGLLTAMRTVRPRTVREFFGLATQHMRWQLNDLARRLDKQPALAALEDEGVTAPPSSSSVLTPDARRMLDAIDQLPEEEREAFNLVRIQGLTYPEAAEIVGVSTKTLQRRLNRARLLLAEQLADLRRAHPLRKTRRGKRPCREENHRWRTATGSPDCSRRCLTRDERPRTRAAIVPSCSTRSGSGGRRFTASTPNTGRFSRTPGRPLKLPRCP